MLIHVFKATQQTPKINIVCCISSEVKLTRWKIALVNYWFSKVFMVRRLFWSLNWSPVGGVDRGDGDTGKEGAGEGERRGEGWEKRGQGMRREGRGRG